MDIKKIQARHPFVRRETIGRSRLGSPIHALEILSDAPGAPRYFFNAAHHANEWITAPLLLDYIFENARELKSRNASFYFVPTVNPDGVGLVTGGIPPGSDAYGFAKSLCKPGDDFPRCWKANAAGVDLNSNYPAGWWAFKHLKKLRGCDAPGPREYAGPYPLSEPESAAIAAYTRGNNFDATVSFHTQGRVVYSRYMNFKPPGADNLAREISNASGYELDDVPDESGHAGYKDWFIMEFNRPGFTIECGFGENPLDPSQFDAMRRETAAVIDLFSNRHEV